jgi:hypothetical protein
MAWSFASTLPELTVTSSIDASASGHWHGHITHGDIKVKCASRQTTRCNIWQARARYVALFPASCAVTLFYVVLFLACLAGVCALVLIGDKLRRVYLDWRERRIFLFATSPRPPAVWKPSGVDWVAQCSAVQRSAGQQIPPLCFMGLQPHPWPPIQRPAAALSSDHPAPQ